MFSNCNAVSISTCSGLVQIAGKQSLSLVWWWCLSLTWSDQNPMLWAARLKAKQVVVDWPPSRKHSAAWMPRGPNTDVCPCLQILFPVRTVDGGGWGRWTAVAGSAGRWRGGSEWLQQPLLYQRPQKDLRRSPLAFCCLQVKNISFSETGGVFFLENVVSSRVFGSCRFGLLLVLGTVELI